MTTEERIKLSLEHREYIELWLSPWKLDAVATLADCEQKTVNEWLDDVITERLAAVESVKYKL